MTRGLCNKPCISNQSKTVGGPGRWQPRRPTAVRQRLCPTFVGRGMGRRPQRQTPFVVPRMLLSGRGVIPPDVGMTWCVCGESTPGLAPGRCVRGRVAAPHRDSLSASRWPCPGWHQSEVLQTDESVAVAWSFRAAATVLAEENAPTARRASALNSDSDSMPAVSAAGPFSAQSTDTKPNAKPAIWRVSSFVAAPVALAQNAMRRGV